jgi:hypothetical protein
MPRTRQMEPVLALIGNIHYKAVLRESLLKVCGGLRLIFDNQNTHLVLR